MCYYELPEVQREIGYDPVPYIAAVSRRRLEAYRADIRAGEAAVTTRRRSERGCPPRDQRAGHAEGRAGRAEPGVRGGDRRVGGRRGDRGRGTGRGRGGCDRARGGWLPPDGVVHGRDRAGAAHAVPRRRGRDGDRPSLRAVRRRPLRRWVHGGERGHVLADAGPGAAPGGPSRRACGRSASGTSPPTSPRSSPGCLSAFRTPRRSAATPRCSRPARGPGAGRWWPTAGTNCTARAPATAAAAARPARNGRCW